MKLIQQYQLDELHEYANDHRFSYIKRIPHEIEQIKICFTADTDQSQGFTCVSNNGNVRTYYRRNDGGSTHTFLVSGDIDGNITQVLSIIYEIQYMQDWIPMVQLSKKYSFPQSMFRMLVQVQVQRILFVACREVLLYGYGDVDNDNVLIFFRSVERQNNELFDHVIKPLPSVDPSHVEAIMNIGGMCGYIVLCPGCYQI